MRVRANVLTLIGRISAITMICNAKVVGEYDKHAKRLNLDWKDWRDYHDL